MLYFPKIKSMFKIVIKSLEPGSNLFVFNNEVTRTIFNVFLYQLEASTVHNMAVISLFIKSCQIKSAK